VWLAVSQRSDPKSQLWISATLWQTYKKLLKMTIEIVDLPTKNGDFPADDIDVLIWVWVNTY